MSLILSLETSTPVCSAAIHHHGKLLASRELHEDQAHGSKLAVITEELFSEAGIERTELEAVAISKGPGSYTGLRIGTSTAKGIAFALNIPLIAVDTLEIMAWQVSKKQNFEGYLCPMLDARRMEVYCSIYDSSLKVIQPLEARVIDENSFSELLTKHKILFFGSGADKCVDLIRNPNAFFRAGIYPEAVSLGEIGFGKFQRNELEDLIHFEPVYLKEFLVKKSIKPLI